MTLLPSDEERDARLLELDGKMGPVRLCAQPRALFDAIASEEFGLKRVIGQFAWQGPVQPIVAARRRLSCTVLRAIPSATAISRELVPRFRQAEAFVSTSHGQPSLYRIKMSPFIAAQLMPKLLTQEVIFSAENWPVFGWNGGRLHTVGRIEKLTP
ncbi:hypothetical protein NKI59_22040 [Mesorhizobium sp. M0598]